MKKVSSVFALAAILSANALGIEFITEAQVAKQLGADKVIEVSKYAVEKLIDPKSDCGQAFNSRSARAYVVKKNDHAYLYLTVSGLKDLNECAEL